MKMEDTFLCLFNLLIASINGLLFCAAKKVILPVKKPCIYAFICLKSNQTIDVKVLAEGFIDLGEVIMNLALISFLLI